MPQDTALNPGAKRIVIVTILSSFIGGTIAATLLFVLHAYPVDALPAAPIYFLCLLGGGGDWGALIFIAIGGFVLYAAYGFALSLTERGRQRAIVASVLLVLHLGAALLCELSRRGQL